MSKRFTITVPDELYTLLTKQAEKDLRTLSQEITYLLRDRLTTTPGGLYYPPGVRCVDSKSTPCVDKPLDLTINYEE